MTSDLHPTLQLTGRNPMGGMKSGHEAARGGVAGGMGCMLHAFAGHQRGNGACQSKVSHPGCPVLPGVATDEPLQAAPRQRQCRGPVVERMVDPIEMCQRDTTQARVGRQRQCGRRDGARKPVPQHGRQPGEGGLLPVGAAGPCQGAEKFGLQRFEDALAKVCRREGVSLIPYSPLAGGVLSGKYQDGALPEGARFSSYLQHGGRQTVMAGRFVNEKSLEATRRYMDIAADAGMAPVTLATAWSKQHDFVASTIVGVSKFDQLADILAAADMELSGDVMKACDAVAKDVMYPMG